MGWGVELAALAAGYFFWAPMLGASELLPALLVSVPFVRTTGQFVKTAASIYEGNQALNSLFTNPTGGFTYSWGQWSVAAAIPLGLMYLAAGYFSAASLVGALELVAVYGAGVFITHNYVLSYL